MIVRDPAAATARVFDLIIVGGGVYGAMVALEAVRRGLAPLLLERDDFGAHTSWNSLRIVHGGLRYLQTLDVLRFRESVRERSWLLENFPDIVRPLTCLMPLYGGLKHPWVLRAALRANDMLSRRRNAGLRADRMLADGQVTSVEETVARFPLVRREGLKGGALWHDAVMEDSERLIVETLHWACSGGATCLNYVQADAVLERAHRAIGVQATDRVTGDQLACHAPVVINCAGPWSREFARRSDRDLPALFRPSLAFNLFIDRPPPFDVAVAVAPPQPGGRVYFLHPWKGGFLAGTFHAPWHGPIEEPVPDETLVLRFLSDLNSAIPGCALVRDDVARIHAGLMPVRTEGTVRLGNRPIIHDHAATGGPKGFFSVSGVKFTTARGVAVQALARIYGQRPASHVPRPVPSPPLSARDLHELLRTDPARAAAHVQQVSEREAVVRTEDLLLRRTDWGYPTGIPSPDMLAALET